MDNGDDDGSITLHKQKWINEWMIRRWVGLFGREWPLEGKRRWLGGGPQQQFWKVGHLSLDPKCEQQRRMGGLCRDLFFTTIDGRSQINKKIRKWVFRPLPPPPPPTQMPSPDFLFLDKSWDSEFGWGWRLFGKEGGGGWIPYERWLGKGSWLMAGPVLSSPSFFSRHRDTSLLIVWCQPIFRRDFRS